MPNYKSQYTPMYNKYNSESISPMAEDLIDSHVQALLAIMETNNFDPREFVQYVDNHLHGRCAEMVLRNALDLRKKERKNASV